MTDNEQMTPTMPQDEPSQEQRDIWEQERLAKEANKIAPCTAAAQQRIENTTIVAEHDSLIADMLFDTIMLGLGEEA